MKERQLKKAKIRDKSTQRLLLPRFPKIFFIPFLALVLFFAILFFLLLCALVHFAGFSILSAELDFYRTTALYLWIISSLIALPIAFYYLNKIHTRFYSKKSVEKEREKTGASDISAGLLFFTFVLGLPFGMFIGRFLLNPFGFFFIRHWFVFLFAATIFFAFIYWIAIKKKEFKKGF